MTKLLLSISLFIYSMSVIAETEQQMEVVAFVIQDRMKLINEVQGLKKELAREKNKTGL